MDKLPTIASLWIGPQLSWLEQLCLKSFADHGHDVVLFCYDKVEGIPEGVRVEDAAEILPTDQVIRHARTGSPAYHADVFRLHMLKKTDYIWVDTDAYCCQPWKIASNRHFHGWISDDKPLVNNGVLRLPKSSKTLAKMLKFTSDEYPIPPWFPAEKQDELRKAKESGNGVHVSLLPWGVWGPNALTWFLKETGEIRHSKPGHVIYPVPFARTGVVLNPARLAKAKGMLREDTLSIHFWGRRFRNVASNFDGIPPEGCLIDELLERHEIDPTATSDLFVKKDAISVEVPQDIDFSMFKDQDLANLLLQRSEIAPVRDQIVEWMAGNDAPLRTYAKANRDTILTAAMQVAKQATDRFVGSIDNNAPQHVADIGPGYALMGLLLYHRYQCHLTLIDIEHSEARRFGFSDEGTGMSDLNTARLFLEKNGVPADKITTLNPKKDDLSGVKDVDLALSLSSCGFFYPLSTYEDLFRDAVSDTGAIIVDVRKGSGGIAYLKAFGSTTVLEKFPKYSTVYTRKGQGDD